MVFVLAVVAMAGCAGIRSAGNTQVCGLDLA